MILPFEANCLPVAPLNIPHHDEQTLWQMLLRWTPNVVVWPVLTPTERWTLAAVGFPGIDEHEPMVQQAVFERESEAHQLAFLRNDLEFSSVPSLAYPLQHAPWRDYEQPTVRALLVGLYGPFSLGMTLVDEQEQPILNNPILTDTLVNHLHLRSGWLERLVGDVAPAAIMCLDEPFWDATGAPLAPCTEAQARGLVEATFEQTQSIRGVAPAGKVDWPSLLETSVRLISCQPDQWEALLACGACLNDYFDRGGVIVWATVPCDPAERERTTPEALQAHWAATVTRALESDILTSRLLSGSLLSVENGLLDYSVENANAALEMLAHVSHLIRKRYKLD